MIGQHQVEHRAFVDDQYVAFQRVIRISFIVVGRDYFQQPVYGFGLHPGRLGQPFGRASRWGRQQNLGARVPVGRDDAQRGRGLARTRTARQDKHFMGDRHADCLHLDGVVMHGRPKFDPVLDLIQRDVDPAFGLENRSEALGHADFAMVERGQIDRILGRICRDRFGRQHFPGDHPV